MAVQTDRRCAKLQRAGRGAHVTDCGCGAVGHLRVIRLPELRAARVALAEHQALVRDAMLDLGFGIARVDMVIAALDHIVDDGYRSRETRGGS